MFRRDAKELPLTTNYRCGKTIIEYAKKYTTNNIHAREDAQDGSVNFNVSLRTAKDGDMVLCRNIAPLMGVYRECVSLGKKVYFRGEELGKTLKISADCSDGKTIPEIIKSMKKRLIFTLDLLSSEAGVDKREAMTNPIIISILDTIKTMENLPKTVETRNDLEKFINDIFSDEGKEGIQLSTIHRAKGLEADNVFVICPSLLPSKLAVMDWEIEEEKHLQYVMCTRPKNNLNFVTEKEIAPHNAFSENNSLYKELENIRTEIEHE
jgi:superfamily I DNA/RNA helicase